MNNTHKSKVINYIIKCLEERQERGFKKYGKTIDEGIPPTGKWDSEVQEELLDALQYKVRRCMELEDEIVTLKNRIKELESILYV